MSDTEPDDATIPNPAPLTPDDRYIVVRGRLWRTANPNLSAERRDALIKALMDARRAVGRAKRAGDEIAESAAHGLVDVAKIALGERGPVWWDDGAPDLNRRMARNTTYAAWFDSLAPEPDAHAPASPMFIGTAGWTIPKAAQDAFPTGDSHLARYSAVMSAAEINSSFHRPHRRSVYAKWAASVPRDFRFSVKVPKEISHTRKLADCSEPLDAFIEQIGGLGDKLGVVLLQLPPKLEFDPQLAPDFLASLRHHIGDGVGIACEPRNATWVGNVAQACLAEHRIGRVVADPVVVPGGERPGGWAGLRYRRLHGSPRMYHSSYDGEGLEVLARAIASDGPAPSWCIFDNTASGAATSDAITLQSLLEAAA